MLLLPSTLTAREACDTLRMLKQAMQKEGNDAAVVVDAGPLVRLDSAALAVLLEVQRLAEGWARPFSIRAAPAKLTALAKLYGVDALLLRQEPAAAAPLPPEVDQRRPPT